MEVCNEIVMKRINEIKPYIRNPRINEKTIELLCKIIPKVGFNVPLVIDEKGVIVKGHARFVAAIRLGMEELPCVITHADEEAIKADRLTDNKISEFSKWNKDILTTELGSIDFDIDFSDFDFEVPSLDFEMEDFDEYLEEKEETHEISDEERKKLYEEFLKEQEEKEAEEVEMTTEDKIKKATEEQKEIGKQKTKYYKVVCEKCGHSMFVKASNVIEVEE